MNWTAQRGCVLSFEAAAGTFKKFAAIVPLIKTWCQQQSYNKSDFYRSKRSAAKIHAELLRGFTFDALLFALREDGFV